MKCLNCKHRPNHNDTVQYCDLPKCYYSYGKNSQPSKSRLNVIPINSVED